MKISIICVGKIKEKYFDMAVDEYVKRLGKYCKLDIIEVADEKTPDHASDAEEEIVKKKEVQRIMKYIKQDACVITLEINGKEMDSEKLAETINNLGVSGKSHIIFVIGGSLGLHREISERADYKLSFSKMTFPHQLMRILLLEQIYRSYRIINGEPYHK